MISKLCAFEPRCDFIINIVIDLFNENPNQQILLLAHYRNILEYFYNKFNELEQSVGYYVGGMKEKALKESENKKIILATYMMAAEALDIKTLSTLIMATPKVNIEQSIGRILRVKHNNPIVIDIIDIHRTFKNQWYKRKKFYNAEKYVITEIKSTNYSPTIWNEKSNSISKCCNSTIQTDTDTDEEAEEKELTNKLLINILHTKLK
jgi:superfamily II DNA or RNA helicase